MVFDHVFQDVPDFGTFLFNEFFRALDGLHQVLFFELLDDERFEKFQRHCLGQAALVDLELGTDHDHAAARIVHALAQKVLAETALFALEQVA